MPTKPDMLLLQQTINTCPDTLFKAYLNQLSSSTLSPYLHPPLISSYPCITLDYTPLTSATLSILLRILYSLQAPLMFMIHISSNKTSLSICTPSLLYPEVGTTVLSQHLSQASIPHTLTQLITTDFFNSSQIASVTSSSYFLSSYSSTEWLISVGASLKNLCCTILCLATPLPFPRCNYYVNTLQNLYNTLYVYQELNYSETYNTNNTTTNVDFNSLSKSTTASDNLQSSDGCTHTTTSTHRDSQKFYLGNNQCFKIELMPECATSANDTKNHSTSTTANTSSQNTSKKDCTDTSAQATANTLSINYRNTIIQVPKLLEHCKNQLNCYSLGAPMFEFATYFLGNNPATTLNGASTLLNYLSSSNKTCMPSALNTWTNCSCDFDTLLTYLSQGLHPEFDICSANSSYSPALPCCLDILSTFLAPSLHSSFTTSNA